MWFRKLTIEPRFPKRLSPIVLFLECRWLVGLLFGLEGSTNPRQCNISCARMNALLSSKPGPMSEPATLSPGQHDWPPNSDEIAPIVVPVANRSRCRPSCESRDAAVAFQ